MALYLLDTDAIIDYLAGFQSSADFIDQLHSQDTLCTCDIVMAEVYSGLHQPARAKAEVLLTQLSFLTATAEIAIQAGTWRYDFVRQGIAISTTNALIAATAQNYGASVVTGNESHYPMTGVSVSPLPRRQGKTK